MKREAGRIDDENLKLVKRIQKASPTVKKQQLDKHFEKHMRLRS
jgi:hypothetical protein